MPSNTIELEVNEDTAEQVVEAWERAVGEGGVDAVGALTVLAESAMKREAPTPSALLPFSRNPP